MLKRVPLAALFLVFAIAAVAQVPRSHHVVVVTMENHSYEQVIGNPDMPYYNQLAQKYGLATQYYATEHNSLTGLMWLVAGTWVTHDDYTTQNFDVDNIVREMKNSGGRTWKVYASQLPSIGFTDYTTSGTYLKRHNPLAYFTDVVNDPAQRNNLVPLDPYFQQDIANGALPEYSYIVPDSDEDAHDGTLAQADQWMQANLPQLLASPQFQQDGLLLVVWDEGTLDPLGNFSQNDDRGEALDPAELVYNPADPDTIWAIPGGRTPTLVIGPNIKPAFQSVSFYNAQNLLRTTCDALALSACPGKGATSVPMSDFFVGQPNTPPRLPREVVITSPAITTLNASGTGSASMHLVATAVDRVARKVTGMLAYIDDQQVAGGDGIAQIDTTLNLSVGTHHLVISAWSTDVSAVAGQPNVGVSYRTDRVLTVSAAQASTTTLTSTAQKSYWGGSVTFSAHVTGAGSSTPGGTVTFNDGSTALGTGTLNSSGLATFTTAALCVGSHTISAIYSGDANNAASTSASTTQTVNPAEFNIAATPASAAVTSGQSASFTLTVTPQGSFTSPINFSCTGLPAHASCAFNSTSLTPNTSTMTTTVTVTTMRASSMLAPPRPSGRHSGPMYAFWMPMGIAGVVLLGSGNKKRLSGKTSVLTLTLVLLIGGLVACGGGGGASTTSSTTPSTTTQATPTGTSQIQITASAPGSPTGGNTAVTQSTTVALTVQ